MSNIKFKKTSAPNNLNWRYMCSSSSGQYLAAALFPGGIYTSSNYGYTWSKTNAPDGSNVAWNAVCCSSSGQYMCACNNSDVGIYISSDYGQTWSLKNILGTNPAESWNAVCISSSGKYITAGANDTYTSNDHGLTWTSNTMPNGESVFCLCCSSDGKYVAATTFPNGLVTSEIYLSSNGTSTSPSWSCITPDPPYTGYSWRPIACSSSMDN
jgi:photosystem II stability/assembly factor-like uncharacterized protein